MIVACDKNWGIVYKGKQLYSFSEDRQFFKEKTEGEVVLMGRKTYQEMKGVLPGRLNIVFSRSFKQENAPDAIAVNDLENTIPVFKKLDNIWVIGGEEIYKIFLPHTSIVYVTKTINAINEKDTYFPNLNKNPNWYISDLKVIYDNDRYPCLIEKWENKNLDVYFGHDEEDF
jgi:dihydrofolate reductase